MQKDDTAPLTERKVLRRGLIAGMAALGAAAMLKVTGAEKTEAANGDPMTAGNSVIASRSTSVLSHNSTEHAFVAVNKPTLSLIVEASGLYGSTDKVAAGVLGYHDAASGNGIGVKGQSSSPTGTGVIGIGGGTLGIPPVPGRGAGVFGLTANATKPGVQGMHWSNGTGVRGFSNAHLDFTNEGNGSGVGVYGKSGSGLGVEGASSTGIGVRGACQSGIGVQGVSDFQPGVEGSSFSSIGVRGLSTHSAAMVGISTNNHGLYGSTSNAAAAGFVGENLAGGLAGYFAGNVFVTGSLQVAGPKNAVIKMQDGTLGSVYCQESPEPYFEDFGRAQLAGGVANVALEREFAALVAGGDYFVYTHPEGDTRGLYVSRRGATGFEVRESQGGTSSASFTYRIVTKRKDVEGRRFARVVDTVAPGLAAARAALGITGTPPVHNATPSPPTPPFVPQPSAPQTNPTQPLPAPNPPSQQLPDLLPPNQPPGGTTGR